MCPHVILHTELTQLNHKQRLGHRGSSQRAPLIFKRTIVTIEHVYISVGLIPIHCRVAIHGGIHRRGSVSSSQWQTHSKRHCMWCGRKFCSAALTETNLPPLSLAFPFPLKYHNYSEKRIKKTWIEEEKKMGSLGEKEKKNNERKQNEKQPKKKGKRERRTVRGRGDRKRYRAKGA